MRTAVIVDGYSSGAGLASALCALGYLVVHVCSNPNIPPVYQKTFQRSDYVEEICFKSNPEHCLKKLAKFEPDFVIAGAECGTEVADLINHRLGLKKSNQYSLTQARRNKALMHEVLKHSGLRALKQYKSSNILDIEHWAMEHNQWPVVLKPLNSAGGEGVHFCHNLQEVHYAATAILGRKVNMLGFENKAVLIQEFVSGPEYALNTVSLDGEHYLCEVWQYKKSRVNRRHIIYQTMEPIPCCKEDHQTIVQYVFDVLNALGIHHGPAHTEIIISDEGPVLIETGARLMGANLPFEMLNECFSNSQAKMTILALTNPEAFQQSTQLPSELKNRLCVYFLNSRSSGTLARFSSYFEAIKALDSFYAMKINIDMGDKLHKTVDYETCPGLIYLYHHDALIIEKNIMQLRFLEQCGLFITHQSEAHHVKNISNKTRRSLID